MTCLMEKNNSGFGWDEHRQLVVAEDAVWNSYINSHKETGQFKHRSFPYYDQLTAIYAKDRAIGKDAQTAADIIEEIDVEDMFQLHNRNQLETKKTYRPLALKSVGALPPKC
ncbi:hypothetical protein E1A91_D13G137200v1 [Gossypium mustelinum]|uniref:Myb/SANT-like domain-containing protein n=1 Tax=Gossypium mustelinum TaxID=34275 RepID=A0A5D2S2V6_GOSMU|nr:hypothetical protein E1A91_D13G137200v1 [Gossypium mustelinum]